MKMIKSRDIRDKREEFEVAIISAISQDDWTPEFKKNLYKIKKMLVEIEELLDTRRG